MRRPPMRSSLPLLSAACRFLALNSAVAEWVRLMTWNIEGGEQPPRVIAQRVAAALIEAGPIDSRAGSAGWSLPAGRHCAS